MTEKQIDFWLRRQFSPIGWVLLGYYLLIYLMTAITMALEQAKQTLWSYGVGDFFPVYDWDAIYNNGWGYITAGLVLLLILYSWKGPDYWLRQVTVKENRMRPGVLLSAMIFCAGAQLLSGIWIAALEAVANAFGYSLMPLLEGVSGATGSKSLFLYSSVAAPIVEELLFRGYILRTLRPYGRRFAIIGSALLFGLSHGNLLQLPYACIAGLVLGYLAAEYSIGWAIVLHVFNNLVLAEGLTRLTEQLPVMEAELVTGLVFGLSFLVSIVILAAKARWLRAWRKNEWVDRRCVKCLLTSLGVMTLSSFLLGSIVGTLYPG